MAEVIIIVAVAKNNVIGRDGTLPWHLPSDLQHFKRTTMGYPLIMGRKTYESIGRPLPGRDNVVLTRDPQLELPEEKVFIIGGADIFKLAMPITDTIIYTALEREVEGDVYLDPIDTDTFAIVERTNYDEEEPYQIIRYERKR